MFLDVTSPFHPYNFCFLLWVTVPTSQLAVMATLQVIKRQESDYTSPHMCETAATFPSKIHRKGIINCSVKCDVLSQGPLGSPLLVSQEDRHIHRICMYHTNIPAVHFSQRKQKV